ncbi:NAD(P)-dependent dehydrogenase, short-chain alcohol dehydrogenase family [Actinopolyspora lacussalsi subsp. righensis]|uniref:NAD(P)-dependent dehydrogenase, short-chain alcohol dehydrogenase family n=1 Tax=Actinopolyspora righensis TaxID=995060 RepID=A0A1I6X1R6_9ACTN|nr:SDR family oxidoreductase [Actinopolyspora righensis]SFT32263.1 NAD(P)-dependent dehydrogenase, short-chain alcohol dehydrogenase family [Actinopolyspora righensis]
MTNTARSNAEVAVVTGANQGIGRQIAEKLSGQGYQLALLDQVSPKKVVEGIDAEAIAITADVSDEDAVNSAKDQVLEHFGEVNLLVNNAGINRIASAEDTSSEQWRRVLEVNLTGPFLLSQAFGAAMLATDKPGSIVNIASIAALGGIPDRIAYNSSKHGLLGLTRTLALEWGARGVRVNAVSPGFVKTEMDEADLASGAYTKADIVDRVPLARFALPEDIAEAVAFLADSNRSGFINGVTLPVDGGWLADTSWKSLRLSKRNSSEAGSKAG